jgi:hypothetical protein
MVKGWLKIENPVDVERALARGINKILTSGQCIEHAGKLASLCNAWVNCRRLKLDSEEIMLIQERLAKLEVIQQQERRR